MYTTSLLLKESTSTSLSTLVEKAVKKKPPFPIYELQLNTSQLILVQKTNPEKIPRSFQPDEGFESDIDSLSIVSSDDSFSSNNVTENKTPETDSANGSASSDSDTESPSPTSTQEHSFSHDNAYVKLTPELKEDCAVKSYNLVNCICYTDVKCTDILVVIIEDDALVFKFDNVFLLNQFHEKFAALKAVNNRVIHNKNNATNKKFNLLQKTDNNGVTHIQIKREAIKPIYVEDDPSSIISLNTPEDNLNKLIKNSVQHIKNLNEYNKTNTIGRRYNYVNSENFNRKEKSASADDLLELNESKDFVLEVKPGNGIKKVWNSSENILDTSPQRPERKKKSKAPLPPNIEIKQDILSGQYVRVHVETEKPDRSRILMRGQIREPHPKKLQNYGIITAKPSLNTLVKNKAAQILRYAPKKFESSTMTRQKMPPQETWTNSIPRFFKQTRSRSETRVAQPMAYRYIDTTINYQVACVPIATANGRVLKSREVPYNFGASNINTYTGTIGNRLFGLSPKLKDFNPQPKDSEQKWSTNDLHRQNGDGHLKSVIKKDENKRKNEKKVTFSAYTTVQVV